MDPVKCALGNEIFHSISHKDVVQPILCGVNLVSDGHKAVPKITSSLVDSVVFVIFASRYGGDETVGRKRKRLCMLHHGSYETIVELRLCCKSSARKIV